MLFTKKNAEATLDKWQPILRLSDWDIEVDTKPRKKMEEEADGLCQAYPDLKEAEITICSGKPSSKFSTHERIAVHELVHCLTAEIADKCPEVENEVEKLVEIVSKSFVDLDDMWRRMYEQLKEELSSSGEESSPR